MNPGRELDALIAEKVMGLVVQKDQVTRAWYEGKKADDPSDYFIGNSNDRVPKYSTSIEAAWGVIQRFKDWRECADFTSDLYRQVKTRLGGELSELYLILHVLPEDICLAALKAVGVDLAAL